MRKAFVKFSCFRNKSILGKDEVITLFGFGLNNNSYTWIYIEDNPKHIPNPTALRIGSLQGNL
jgi:hypothetical protein